MRPHTSRTVSWRSPAARALQAASVSAVAPSPQASAAVSGAYWLCEQWVV